MIEYIENLSDSLYEILDLLGYYLHVFFPFALFLVGSSFLVVLVKYFLNN